MILPSIQAEKNLIERGGKIIIGVDEAGRGPLAGPVVAGAVWIRPEILEQEFDWRNLVRDSKTLSHNQREKVFAEMQENENFFIGIGEVSSKMIDRLNILNASLLAMRLAIENLIEDLRGKKILKEEKVCVMIDGNKKIHKVVFEQHIFPKGDRNIFSIAAASICAKVYRDRLMDNYHQEFPHYGFDHHRGYGTKKHFEMLRQFGPCSIHRKSFNLGEDL